MLETVDELRKRGIRIGSTTGYTDKMMEIVVSKAKENGYEPDAWFHRIQQVTLEGHIHI